MNEETKKYPKIDIAVAAKTWSRYGYGRDNGHLEFMMKSDLCFRNFRGDQWEKKDKAALDAVGRPALTINKLLPTISTIAGEQIYNRNEISFRPLNGSPEETAEALRKTYKQISNNNQLDWRRSDMFLDGIITSRGFMDVRMDFSDNMRGEVRITNVNPKNVIIDPDAEGADPDSWNEVTTSKWMTVDDIVTMYGVKDVDVLNSDGMLFGEDYSSAYSDLEFRDRVGLATTMSGYSAYDKEEGRGVLRTLRVIERQHKMLDSRDWFVDHITGNMRPIPEGWDAERISAVRQEYNFEVIKRVSKRIRWTVVTGNLVLHDEWSPYEGFTIIPYFPYFMYGKTMGLVENLIDSQQLLNKTSSQELHVINTTANSGYKVKTGALANMTPEELEANGARTGLVIEMNNSLDEIEKLQPNPMPQGLERVSYKAEEHIKSISNVGDSQQGQDRADVAAKAIQQKRQAASTSQAKPMDSLNRSDFYLARTILRLIQTFMTEEQIISITNGGALGGNEEITVNQVTPEGTIVNDLTLGEYAVVMTSVPQRETLEDSQFEQAIALKELGVNITDRVLIESSRLMNKKEAINEIESQANSPAAQEQAQIESAMRKAELSKLQTEAEQKQANTALIGAKTQSEGVKTQKLASEIGGDDGGAMDVAMFKAREEAALARDKFEFEKQLAQEKMDLEREKLKHQENADRIAQKEKSLADRIGAVTKGKDGQ